MRALGATVGTAFGLAGIAVASAADLSSAPGGDLSPYYFAHGRRAGMLVIYDDQPGVVVRPYWRAPWQHRHYYPATGAPPKVGRHERSARGGRYARAESYRRYWSNASAFLPDLAPPGGRYIEARPWAEPGEPPLK